MAYKWTSFDINRSLLKLKKIIDKTTSWEDKLYYSKVFGETLNVLNMFEYNLDMETEPSLNDRLIELTSCFYTNNAWYSLAEEIYKRVEVVDAFSYDATQAINRRISQDKSFTLDTGSYIGHDRVLSMVDDFYRRFDPDIYEYYKIIHKHRRKAFDFVSVDENSTSECFLVDGPKDFFINIVNNYGIKKYCDSVHECGHVIEFLMNSRMCYNDNPNYFTEVASIFPELVAFEEGFHSKEKDNYLYQYFCSLAATLDELASLMNHSIIVDAFTSHDCKSDGNFFKYLKEEYDISKKDVIESLDVKIEGIGTYITSMATSLELLHIYKKDKKKALELFKQLLMVHNDCNINAQYMNAVPFTDGMVKELTLFKDEYTSLLDRNGVRL